jgi:septation ring formation regulator EzrA
MTYYVIGFLVLVAVFVAGFFVGKKHGQRLGTLTDSIKDVVGKG